MPKFFKNNGFLAKKPLTEKHKNVFCSILEALLCYSACMEYLHHVLPKAFWSLCKTYAYVL